jgi:hypothetical protein
VGGQAAADPEIRPIPTGTGVSDPVDAAENPRVSVPILPADSQIEESPTESAINRGIATRFQPGNQLSRGRHKMKRYSLKSAMRDEVTEDRWRAIVVKALEQAEEGDDHARDWLSGILIGKNIKVRGMVLHMSPEQAQQRIDQLFGLDVQIGTSDDDTGRSST